MAYYKLCLDVAQSHHARRIGMGRRQLEFRIDAIGEHAPQTSRSFARAKALAQDDNVWWLAGKKKKGEGVREQLSACS